MRKANFLLEKAIKIAVHAHTGQKERNGQPYIMHPLRVMQRVNTVEEKIVAVLHDVVEDTPWTPAMLTKRGFPKHLLDALDCVTIRKGEPYPAAIRRAASNPIARRVKLADLEDNTDIHRLPHLKTSDRNHLNKYLRVHRWLTAQRSARNP
jgi:(p)ppGpp synthase/HD superfamily hydrolase